jgi:serine/threonine-protein kinase
VYSCKGVDYSFKEGILFDKYLLEQPIGSGLSGIVYLAEHRKLQAKRVIKCVDKKQFLYQQFLSEATLLKNLKHPGIPIIYDLEEDEEYLYIIEEYIQGESLRAFMLNQNAISRDRVIDFTIQICNIIEYLHNREPYPVLYLDLKPDHIILCSDCVKIIDFGAAIYLEKEELDYSFGTPCFAAPEQFNSLKLDSKADIYAIGGILYYMLVGKNPSPSNSEKSLLKELLYISTDLKKIIMKCMAENPDNRYETVSQLKSELEVCLNYKKSLIMAVLGSQNRIGTTHVAIGIVSYLNRHGIKAVFEEKGECQILESLYDENQSVIEKNGIYYLGHFVGIPKYDVVISVNKEDYDVIVMDCGCGTVISENFKQADMRVFVLGSKEWEMPFTRECMNQLQDLNLQYVFNLCEKKQALKAAKELNIKKGYKMPIFINPFKASSMSDRVLKDMLRELMIHGKTGKKEASEKAKRTFNITKHRNNGS